MKLNKRGHLHKRIEQLAVEIVRLGAIRTSEHGREQPHLLHNQVLLCGVLSAVWNERKEAEGLTTDETSVTSVKRTAKDQQKKVKIISKQPISR